MKILIHDGKHGHGYYDISTREKEEGAYRHLMDQLGQMGYYECSDPQDRELQLFNAAIAGEIGAAKRFIEWRSGQGHEYEGVTIEEIKPHVFALPNPHAELLILVSAQRTSEELDEHVDEAYSNMATDTNNSGVEEQTEFLIKQLGIDWARDMLLEADDG